VKTLATHYCEQQQMLEEQLALWSSYSIEVLASLEFVVVDDCSTTRPAAAILKGCNLPVRVLRLQRSVPWNFSVVRNLAIREALHAEVLLFDLDHFVPAATAAQFLAESVQRGTFSLCELEDQCGTKLQAHQHCAAYERTSYLETGGYDESWSGYNSDWLFVPRRASQLTRKDIGLRLVRRDGQGCQKWQRGGRFNVLSCRKREFEAATKNLSRPCNTHHWQWTEEKV
jgi:glycosyltransferase involved in cell wall biosynthesis